MVGWPSASLRTSCSNRSLQPHTHSHRSTGPSAGQPLQPPGKSRQPAHRLRQASGPTNEASGRPGRASPITRAGGRRRQVRGAFVLAGRALRVPVASVPDGPPRTTAVGWRRAELGHRRSIRRGRTARTRLPSSCPPSLSGRTAAVPAVGHTAVMRPGVRTVVSAAETAPDSHVHDRHRRPLTAMCTAVHGRALQRSLQVRAQVVGTRCVRCLSIRASTPRRPSVQPMSAKRPQPMATPDDHPERQPRADVLGSRIPAVALVSARLSAASSVRTC